MRRERIGQVDARVRRHPPAPPPAVVTGGSVRYYGNRITQGGNPVEILALNKMHALRWREIAIVFQSAMNALNPVLRVQDQILDAIQAHLKTSRSEAKEKAATLLDLVGIPGRGCAATRTSCRAACGSG